jgi:uncharacterized protein (DUF2147 family)
VKDIGMRITIPASGALVAALLASAPAVAAGPDSVLGQWRATAKHGLVEISRCGNSICGRLLESDNIRSNPELRDLNNKDSSQRGRKLKGLQILGGFKGDAGQWSGGTIYNPEDGGTYKATITPAGQDTLKLKGCIVWPLCKTQTWTRVR